jgi:hypothetical protein
MLLNIALAGTLVWIGVQLRAHWVESAAREQAALDRKAKAVAATPPAAVPPVEPTTPATYIDVAQKTLFSKDRDPNVIIEAAPPPPPPPEPPVPTFPKYHGQMAFGDPVLVLSTEKTPQKSYRAGEDVGEFKLEEFDRDSATFSWNGKTFKKQLREIAPKEGEKVVQAAAPAAAPAPAAPKPAPVAQPKGEAALGAANGMYRACVVGDNSPAGTVVGGYRKNIIPGMMGVTCQWEPIR